MNNRYQKYVIIDGVSYEVVEAERFFMNPIPWPIERTALLFSGHYFGTTLLPDFVLPFRNDSDAKYNKPGIYGINPARPFPPFNWIIPFTFDSAGNIINCVPDFMRTNVRDMSDVKTIVDLIEADKKYKEEEFSRLSAGKENTQFFIGTGDAPETAIFKQAINSKNIDFDLYRDKIGKTYPNDKRMLAKSRSIDDPNPANTGAITLPKMRDIGKALDMKIYLIIDNTASDVVNPISSPLMVDVTDGDSSSVVRIAGIPEVIGPVNRDYDEDIIDCDGEEEI